jgi:hypothetical protein
MKIEREIPMSALWAVAPVRHHGVLCSLLALTLLVSAPAVGASAPIVGWTQERLSVTAEAAPLADLLAEVARRTGIRIDGAETLEDEVTISFSELTLREGLRRLLAPVLNYAIIEEPLTDGGFRPTLVRFVGPHLAGTGLVPSVEPAQDPGSVSLATAGEESGGRLDKFLADPDAAVRRWAVERLADVGDEWGFSRLLTALQDRDPGVREAAITALNSHGPPAIKPVTLLLQTETQSPVRIAALQLLGNFGLSELAGLFHGMLGDSDPGVRRAAVEALVQADASLSSEALRTAALDQDVGVRAAALDGLGIYGRDPNLAIEAALVQGDKTTQAIAAELRGSLIANGRWNSADPDASTSSVTFEAVDSD